MRTFTYFLGWKIDSVFKSAKCSLTAHYIMQQISQTQSSYRSEGVTVPWPPQPLGTAILYSANSSTFLHLDVGNLSPSRSVYRGWNVLFQGGLWILCPEPLRTIVNHRIILVLANQTLWTTHVALAPTANTDDKVISCYTTTQQLWTRLRCL